MQDLLPIEDQHMPSSMRPLVRVQRVRRARYARLEGLRRLPDMSQPNPESRHHVPVVDSRATL